MFEDGLLGDISDVSNQISTAPSPAPSTSSQTPKPPAKKRKRKATEKDNEKVDEDDEAERSLMAKCMKIISADDKDSFATFGEHVASKLRRFANDEILQIQTQHAIERILMESTDKYLASKYIVVNSDGSASPFSAQSSSVQSIPLGDLNIVFGENQPTEPVTQQPDGDNTNEIHGENADKNDTVIDENDEHYVQ